MLPLTSVKDHELKNERDRDIYLTYLFGLREGIFDDLNDAALWVQRQPAPKFYVSAKSLVNYIAARQAGKDLSRMYYWNRLKMEYLYSMYLHETDGRSCKIAKEILCEELVERPAPYFYISVNYVRKIIQRECKKGREKILNKYCK